MRNKNVTKNSAYDKSVRQPQEQYRFKKGAIDIRKAGLKLTSHKFGL